MASLILDVVLFALILMILIKYTIVGFVKSALNLVKLVLSVILAVALRAPLAQLFDKWFMQSAVVGWVNTSLTKSLEGQNPTVDFVKIYNDTPQFYSSVLSNFGLDAGKLDAQMNSLGTENVQETAELIGAPFANLLSTILAVIAIFAASMIVLTIVVWLINKLLTHGLKLANTLLGTALGLVVSAATVWGVGFVVGILINLLGPVYPNIFNQELVDKSMVLGMVEKLGINSLMNNIIKR